jgi:hypothetical protein
MSTAELLFETVDLGNRVLIFQIWQQQTTPYSINDLNATKMRYRLQAASLAYLFDHIYLVRRMYCHFVSALSCLGDHPV